MALGHNRVPKLSSKRGQHPTLAEQVHNPHMQVEMAAYMSETSSLVSWPLVHQCRAQSLVQMGAR
jgi:hypothetical protein